MANQDRIKHNNKISKMQLENAVEKINQEISENNLKEYWSIINSISSNVKDYFINIYNPTFNKRLAEKILSSGDYNKNVEEVINDLQNAHAESNSIKENLKNNFNRNTIISQEITNELNKLKNNIDIVEGLMDESEVRLVSGKENFKNLDYVDEDKTTADIDLLTGSASIERDETVNQNNEEATVEIQSTSNGFSGTHHEVKVRKQVKMRGNLDSAPIRFIGESNPHKDINKIQDQNPDTWFEYELCNIPESKKQNPCKGYGFKYKDGTVWAKDPNNPNYLLLHLKIILPEPVKVNYINILPYIPVNDSNGAEIDLLRTYPEASSSSQPTEIVSKEDDIVLSHDEESGIFQFAPRTIKEIEIKLKKENPYRTKIGHIFFVRTTKTQETDSILWISDTDTEVEKKRVKGMVETSPGKREGVNILGGLYSNTETILEDKVEPGVEWFWGSRWTIGIKDIGVNTYTYLEESKLISKEYISPGPIKKIQLNTKEYIPREFYKDGGTKYNWIKYYISIDDGGKWHEIAPVNTEREGIKEYYINSMNPEETAQPNVSNLETDRPVQRVKVKVELTRPGNINHSQYFSPILRGYELKMFSAIEEV